MIQLDDLAEELGTTRETLIDFAGLLITTVAVDEQGAEDIREMWESRNDIGA